MTIDVRCLPYMPLHIERLRRSKAWLRCKRRPELAFYLMNLWMRAWHEVPAGSIEADDDVLADAAMCSPDEWERIKGDVLQGWDLREGRWHHHVVTELAADGLEKVEASRRRTEAARQARQQNRSASVTSSVTDNVADTVTASKEKEKGREEEPSSPPSEVRPPKSALGSFLSPDWQPTPQAMAAAERELGSPEAASRELLKFRNHWLAKAGKDGRKRDWDRTWQNWYLSDIAKRANRHEQQPRHPIQNAFDQAREHAQRMEDAESAADGWGAGAGRENLLC